LKDANRARIHTFIATSALHMEKKLRMTPEQVLEQARQAVRFGRNLIEDIEFSAEDGYRSEPDFLARVIEAVIKEGATTINVPDTVGYAIPELYGEFIRNSARARAQQRQGGLVRALPQRPGMAVANSLAGVKIGGARQIECTINGLGERAGNCSLEEVVMAIKTRKDYFGLDVNIDTQHIVAASRLVSQTTGFVVQPNKAVVGPTPLPMPPAFIRTACSRLVTPTKSCVPRTWAGRPTRSCWASSVVATPSSSACRSWGGAGQRSCHQPGLHALQGARGPQERDFDEDILALLNAEGAEHQNNQFQFISLAQQSETGERPHASVVFSNAGREIKASPKAMARSMPRSRPSSPKSRAVPKWCCIPSMPSAARPRARAR
jgi:2-isopropylmalate synthase